MRSPCCRSHDGMSHAHVQLEITGCSAPPTLARCVVLAVVTMTVSSSIVLRCVPPNGTNPGNERLKQIIDGWVGLHRSGAAVVVQRHGRHTRACFAVSSAEVDSSECVRVWRVRWCERADSLSGFNTHSFNQQSDPSVSCRTNFSKAFCRSTLPA